MKSLEEIRREVKRQTGLGLSRQTFHSWYNAGLVEAQKQEGRGNLLWLTDDEVQHIVRIRRLSEMGMSQKALKAWNRSKGQKTLVAEWLAIELMCRVLDRKFTGKVSADELKAIRADVDRLWRELNA